MALTSLDFLASGQTWPPAGETARLTIYQQNRHLFEGDHELVFKDWVRLLREDQQATLEIVLNWPKRLTLLWAALLLGEPPRISVADGDSDKQDWLERINRDGMFVQTVFEAVIDMSRYGDGLLKARRDEGGHAVVEAVQPSIWFPVVSRDNVRDIRAHVLAWTFSVPDGRDRVRTYLRAETHEKGRLTNRLFLVRDGRIASEVDLDTLADYARLEPVQQTGVNDFLIVQVPNLRTTDRIHGVDDYADLDCVLQELETRVAQISRILDKHADPNLYGPASALELDPKTGQWAFKGGGKFFPVEPGEDAPGYVTWDGQLDAAFREIDWLLEQLYVLSETSPAAFGQLKTGLAESGSALRRLMMAPLAKVNRLRVNLEPAVKRVLWLAAALEGLDLSSTHIEWQDGLPRDEMETAQIETARLSAGNTSVESSVRRLDGLDGEALQEELQRIRADRPVQASPVAAAARPTVTLPPAPGQEG